MRLTELFTDASKWTKRGYALDAAGNELVSGRDPNAVCFCLLGGIEHCYPGRRIDDSSPVNQIVKKIRIELGEVHLYTFNDAPETTFEMVKALVCKLDI